MPSEVLSKYNECFLKHDGLLLKNEVHDFHLAGSISIRGRQPRGSDVPSCDSCFWQARERERETDAQNKQPRNICDAWMCGALLTNLFQVELLPLYTPLLCSHFPDHTFHYLTHCLCHVLFTSPGLFYVPNAWNGTWHLVGFQ